MRAIPLDVRAWRSWPFLRGVAYAEPGTVIQGPDGTTVRVREDGGVDPVVQGGAPHAGIAADPATGRRP